MLKVHLGPLCPECGRVMHQLAAVRGLRETQPPSVGMVNVLRRGMEDASIFCRVRGEAAMALAVGAGTEHNGEQMTILPMAHSRTPSSVCHDGGVVWSSIATSHSLRLTSIAHSSAKRS